MTTETIRITKLPKSKMQAIRQYTGLRAFCELDENGHPAAYFIESHSESQLERQTIQTGIKRPRRNPVIPRSVRLGLGPKIDPKPYDLTSVAARVHDLVVKCVPATRGDLEDICVSELSLTAGQARSQLSYALHVGKTLMVIDA